MKVYIAGPMTGIPLFNFPAFEEAARKWRYDGWEVVNPAEAFDGATDRPYVDYIRKDVADILTVQAMAFLPGWEKSKGACFEKRLAEMLEIKLFDALTFRPLQAPTLESILTEADRLVSTDRQADYGHPIEDFTRTGKLWGAIIDELQDGEPVAPEKVAMCMVALKLSRECNKPKRDNRVDAAGYVKTLQMVREKQGFL